MKWLIYLLIACCSLTLHAQSKIEFVYPKNEKAAFVMKSDKFKKFKEEWKGEDYYYFAKKAKDGFDCTVKFYTLNFEEKNQYVDMIRTVMGDEIPKYSPTFAQTYFMQHNPDASLLTNMEKWGDAHHEFSYSQADLKDDNVKRMYAYGMLDDALFVQIMLSKKDCTPQDSIAMRSILEELKKK